MKLHHTLIYQCVSGPPRNKILVHLAIFSGEHSKQFHKAVDLELEALTKRNAWVLVPRPQKVKVIPGTWDFKIKSKPDSDGSFGKFKARFCV